MTELEILRHMIKWMKKMNDNGESYDPYDKHSELERLYKKKGGNIKEYEKVAKIL